MPRRSRARRNTQAAQATDFDLRRTTRQLLTASSNSPQRHLSGGAPRDSSTNHPTLNKGVVQGSALARTHRWQQVGRVAIKAALAAPLSKGAAREPRAPRMECVNHPQFATVFGYVLDSTLERPAPGGTVESGVRGQGGRAASSNALDLHPFPTLRRSRLGRPRVSSQSGTSVDFAALRSCGGLRSGQIARVPLELHEQTVLGRNGVAVDRPGP